MKTILRCSAPTRFALALAGGATLAFQQGAPRGFDRVLLLESTSETSASASLGDVDGNGLTVGGNPLSCRQSSKPRRTSLRNRFPAAVRGLTWSFRIWYSCTPLVRYSYIIS